MTGSPRLQMIEQWGLFELELRGSADGNPFLDAEFGAQFAMGQRAVDVTGFYDGDSIYRVRFMPDALGIWTFRTRSNQPALDGIEGEFQCIAPSAGNHGPVHVAGATHFAYADGTPYRPVGSTCYVWQLQDEALQEQTLETLKDAPFNKLRFLFFPKRYLHNLGEPCCYPFPGSINRPVGQPQEGRRAFERPATPPTWDLERFNPEYFRHLERRILDLQRLGIEADLILFHPYDHGSWDYDQLPREVNDRLLRYLVARLAAFRNLWWSFANEYDLMANRTEEDWDHYMQLVQALDPHQHLRSIHNALRFYDHHRPWVTHCSVQHSDLSKMAYWLRVYGKPVVVDECGYEGDIDQQWGNLPPQELMRRFWLGFADGGYVGHGETYLNPEDVLWWSKGGVLHGESVPRIAFLREIIEQVPGDGLSPIAPLRFSEFTSAEEMRAYMSDTTQPREFKYAGAEVLRGNPMNLVAGGHSGKDYYLLYFGIHQPRRRTFSLPEGSFRVDIIDTWNMKIEEVSSCASGTVTVELPVRPYMAVRIVRTAPAET